MKSVGWRVLWRIFVLVALVVATVPIGAATAAGQGSLTVSLTEDPFVCDTVVRPLGTVSGLIPGETVQFSSPQINGVFSQRTADALGQVAMRWNCNTAKVWNVSVRGLTSGASADFVVTGITAPPPPQAPVGAAFDAKTAMTAAEMAIWKDFSPYNTAGVYIPVNSDWDNRADKIQRNLTASWMNEVLTDGWRIIPIYVGRQAPKPCQTARFDGVSTDPGIARNQGFEAANDAVASVSSLGLGPGSPIYYDMEAYRPGCADAVLAFLDAWTEGVHAAGYISGVYGSRSSTMWDLSRAFGRAGFDAPDAVWVSTGNGRPVSLGLEVPADGLWTNARIHQYRLSVTRTYGGVTLEVDENIVDAPLATLAPVAPTPVPQAIVDADGDGFAEPEPDNCDSIANPDQADLDADGDGDVCDSDIDGDGVANDADFEPRDPFITSAPAPTAVPTPEPTAAPEPTAVPQIVDSDGDGFAEPEPDNCDSIANPDQADLDADGDGDVCDSDIDGDGVSNDADTAPRDATIGAAEATPEPTAPTEPPEPTEPEPTEPEPTNLPEPTVDTVSPTPPPLPTAVPAQVIVLPTPAVPTTPPPTEPTPQPTPTMGPSAAADLGDGSGTDVDASPDTSSELASDVVTITVEQDNPLLPYAVVALAAFSLFCVGMGARSFTRNRQIARAL